MAHHHQHLHRRVHLHNPQRRQLGDVWGDFTSAIGNVFSPETKTSSAKAGPSTIYKTVYTTQTPSGYTGPLTTKTSDSPHQTTSSDPPPTSSAPPDQLVSDTSSITPSSSSKLPAAITATTPSTVGTQLAVDTGTPTTQTTPAVLPATVTPTPTPTPSSTPSSGTSAAAKAGIAIGVLGGIFVVFAIVFFAFRKRRQQLEQKRREDDEKINGPFGDSAAIGRSVSTKTTPNAPRLSLRPVTQFLPNLNPGPHPDRRTSRGAAIALVPGQTMARPAPAPGLWERPATSAGANANHANPFGDGAERLDTPAGQEHAPVSPVSSFGTAVSYSPPGGSPIAGAAVGAAAGGMAAGGMTRKASIRRDGPKALDLTLPPPLSAVPPSPAGTEFSVNSVAPGQAPGPSSSAAAIAAAGGPAMSAVHRVQLDFKPTLEDEMELRAGQLVRLLHEYDDGWVSDS